MTARPLFGNICGYDAAAGQKILEHLSNRTELSTKCWLITTLIYILNDQPAWAQPADSFKQNGLLI